MAKDKIQKHTRELLVSGLKVREATTEGEVSRTIEGYAAKWNERSRLLNDWWENYYEILDPGCMSREMLNKQDIIFTQYHDIDKVLGRSRNGKGTLYVEPDEIGLKVVCDMPRTIWGDETLELVKRGDLTGMSFVYATREDDENAVEFELITDDNGEQVYLRHVKRIDMVFDVSVVRFPAYEKTEVSARERELLQALKKREDVKTDPDDEEGGDDEADDTKEKECKNDPIKENEYKKREALDASVAKLKREAQKTLRQLRPLY